MQAPRRATRLVLLAAFTIALLLIQSVDGASTDRSSRRVAANIALADRIVVHEILLYGNLDLADEVIAPHAFVQTPDGIWHGPAGLRSIASSLGAAVADLRLGFEAVEADGDAVLMHWVLSGTIREPVLGLDPTDEPVLVTGTLAVHVLDGLVTDVVLATTSQAQPLAEVDA